MLELTCHNHAKYLLLAHIILVCKYIKQLLIELGDPIKSLLSDCSRKHNFDIYESECDKDHIHLLVSYLPTQSIFNIVSRLKQHSTFHIWRNHLHEPILRRNFWKERTFWSDGYFASSIGQASLETIQDYIRQQG